MPPKVKFTKEEIIDAAFRLVAEGGMKNLSTTKVAKKLNSSVHPIYSNLNSVRNLKKEVYKQALLLFKEYVLNKYDDKLYISFAIGEALFAWDHRNLHIALSDENEEEYLEDFYEFSIERMNMLIENEDFADVPKNKVVSFYMQSGAYTIGLGKLISTDYFRIFGRDDMYRAVRQAVISLYEGIIVKGIKG